MNSISALRAELKGKRYHPTFQKLYRAGDDKIDQIALRYDRLLDTFAATFGEQAVEVFSTPGRTELGGNHTDHQLGHVIAAAINLDAVAVAARSDSNCVVIVQEQYETLVVDLNRLEYMEEERTTTAALVRGIARGLRDRGYEICGFSACISNDVRSGSGLSSSAVIEVLIGTIFSWLANDGKVSEEEIAEIAQFAENIYFGKPCGLMDQMACAVGGLIHIDFAKSGSERIKRLEAGFDTFPHICITNTGGSHANLADEYADIPNEMKAVARFFGKQVLSQVEMSALQAHISEVRSAAGDRAVLRALHFFREDQRVKEEFEALSRQDVQAFLRLVQASGDSSFKYLQNVYSNRDISHQELAIALALSESLLAGAGACRVHGGGFAGTIQAFVPKTMSEQYCADMDRVFGPGACQVLQIREGGGMKVF